LVVGSVAAATETTDDFVRLRLALVDMRRQGVEFEQAFSAAIDEVVPPIRGHTMQAKERGATREILRATLDAWRDAYQDGQRKLAKIGRQDLQRLRAV
jgi:hypothetical protein